MTIENSLEQAIKYFLEGNLSKAEALCNEILSEQPDHPETLRVCGHIALQSENNELALEYISKAIATSPHFAEAYESLGQVYQALGQIDDAIDSYQKSMELNDANPHPFKNLGALLSKLGRYSEAIDLLNKAQDLNPNDLNTLIELGNAYMASGQLAEAEHSYLSVVDLDPGIANAWYNLGNVQLGLGSIDRAIESYQKTLTLLPEYAEAYNNLGVAYKNQGRLKEAVSVLEQAVLHHPEFTIAYDNLGTTLLDLERPAEAVKMLEQAVRLEPGLASVQNNLGNAYKANGQLENALSCYREVLLLEPDDALGHFNLGIVYNAMKKVGEAVSSYLTCIEMEPNDPRAYVNLGILYRGIRFLDDAVDNLEKAIEVQPDFSLAHSNLGLTYLLLGRIDEAIKEFRTALTLTPEDEKSQGNLIYTMQFHPEIKGEEVLEEARRWDELFAAPINTTDYRNTPEPERKIRIGYVSADFKHHAVSILLEPLLSQYDRDHFEVYCYSQVSKPDDTTERIMKSVDVYRSTVGVSDEAMDRMIRDDAIDIIVECTGQTKGNRLLALSRKPAPIQINFFQMHGTTSGMTSMDYAFSDPVLTPPESEHHFSEKLIKLKHGAFIFRPDQGWPDVAPAREPDADPVFACVGAPERISDVVIDLWAQLLEMTPNARMLFKHPSYSDRKTCSVWERKFSRLKQWSTYEGVQGSWTENMDVYGRVDIVLDTFPMTGATSTIIPLWMGVPVLILSSGFYGHRVGLSALTNANASAFIVKDSEEYLKTATDLINDRERLNTLRLESRDLILNAPICNARERVNDIEAAFREIWRTWCHEQNNPVQ